MNPFSPRRSEAKAPGWALAVSHGIVTQAGGHIGVSSEAGVGTTFKIYLPHVAGVAVPASHSVAKRLVAGGDETILLAEDEPLVRAVAVQALSAQGYTVLVANNGVAALELARGYGGVIHLVLTDVVMPQMGGPQLVEQLTAVHPSDQSPVYVGLYRGTIVQQGMMRTRRDVAAEAVHAERAGAQGSRGLGWLAGRWIFFCFFPPLSPFPFPPVPFPFSPPPPSPPPFPFPPFPPPPPIPLPLPLPPPTPPVPSPPQQRS